MNGTLLMIEPNELHRLQLKMAFQEADFEVVSMDNVLEGLLAIVRTKPDLIVLSDELPSFRAEDLLPVIRQLSHAPVMVVGKGDERDEIAVLDQDADCYLHYPVSDRIAVAYARALVRGQRGRTQDGLWPRDQGAAPTRIRHISTLTGARAARTPRGAARASKKGVDHQSTSQAIERPRAA